MQCYKPLIKLLSADLKNEYNSTFINYKNLKNNHKVELSSLISGSHPSFEKKIMLIPCNQCVHCAANHRKE